VTREDWLAAIAVFIVLFTEILLVCVWIVAELWEVLHPERQPVIFLLSLLPPLVCAGLVACHFTQQRLRRTLIEDLTPEINRRRWSELTLFLTGVDYCLLVPLFLIAYLLMRALFLAVLDRIFGVPEPRIPVAVAVLAPSLLAASLTASHMRRRLRRRSERILHARAHERERRGKQLAERLAALEEMHCPECGYNLTGLPERRCPECGQTWSKAEEEEAMNKR